MSAQLVNQVKGVQFVLRNSGMGSDTEEARGKEGGGRREVKGEKLHGADCCTNDLVFHSCERKMDV